MAVPVKMPKVDMDQETGTVVAWHKSEGQPVRQGETILTIETDKVSIEVEAPASGILHNITAFPGDRLPIASVIATILEPGETPSGTTLTSQPAETTHALSPEPEAVPGKINATPAARRAARLDSVDLATLKGSGPRGRIQIADVLAVAEAAAQAMAAAVKATPAEELLAPLAQEQAQTKVEIIPLEGMRRTIAERVTWSYQSAPHITLTMRVDMNRFNQARAELNEHAEQVEGVHISATAMFVKAIAATLPGHPLLNSSLRGEEIHLHKEIHIGVAVALEQGLIVPIVHDATHKGVAQIAAEVEDLARRAREGKLAPADVSGGTFTLSNLGPFGVEQFTAILNPPQAAILAVGAAQPEAVPGEAGAVVFHPILRMTLSADHRVVDGAVAARFLSDLKAALEKPVLMLW